MPTFFLRTTPSNIASHIREEMAMIPGKRMLVIIGAGHKPFLDHYLREMTDLQIVHLSNAVCQMANSKTD